MRKFLEKNKIYFEVFSLTFLGLMGIVVSISQAVIARRELKIHEKELLPTFSIKYQLFKSNDTSNVYDTEMLTISNEGRAIKKMRYELKTFYKFEFYRKNTSLRNTILYAPISDYFILQYITNEHVGKLLEAVTKGNNENFFDVYKCCMKKTKDNNFLFVDKISLLKISYIDLSGDSHDEYYSGTNEIDESNYKNVISSSNKYFGNNFFSQKEINEDLIDSIFNNVK